jgi:hypothetical protein
MFVRCRPDQGGDFFFEHGGEGEADEIAHRVSHPRLKVILTKLDRLGILGSRSHGILLYGSWRYL